MKRINLSWLLLLLALCGLWLLADTLAPAPLTYFSFRTALVQFTGVIAMGAMSVAMLLAIRPRWLTQPERKPPAGQSLGTIEVWLRGQRGTAEFLGERAFYAAVLLIALALVKRFPYHLFTKTHTWLAAIFGVLVYHSVVLTKIDYWSQPVGWVLALLMLGGTWAAALAWQSASMWFCGPPDLLTPPFIKNYFRCAETPITPQTKVDPFLTAVTP